MKKAHTTSADPELQKKVRENSKYYFCGSTFTVNDKKYTVYYAGVTVISVKESGKGNRKEIVISL